MAGVIISGELTEPVRGGGQGDTLGTDGQGEDFANDDPRAGAPGGGEEGDVDADEADHGLDGAIVGGLDGANDGHDELADEHAESTPDQKRTATEPLHGPEGEGRGADVDEGGDERDEEGVVNSAQLLEEGGSEVEDKVDTSPMSGLELCDKAK